MRAQTIDDAVAAVRLARELGLKLATRSGGHRWCAAALRDDSLLLDLSRLNDLRIDHDGRRMTVGPGLTNGGLTGALAGHGLGFPAGHCRDVGLGGYLLTGGLGWNAGTWGPACHSVAAVEVITAQGDVVVADDRHDPDLLWAARGAGSGFFAVATSFEARLYEAPRSTLTSSFAFPLSALADVAAWVAWLADGLDRRLELSLAFASAPAALAALGIEAGRPIVVVTAVAFADSREECDALLARLEDGIGRRGFLESEARRETPQQALYELTGARLPAGRQFAADCLWSDEEPLALFEALRPTGRPERLVVDARQRRLRTATDRLPGEFSVLGEGQAVRLGLRGVGRRECGAQPGMAARDDAGVRAACRRLLRRRGRPRRASEQRCAIVQPGSLAASQ